MSSSLSRFRKIIVVLLCCLVVSSGMLIGEFLTGDGEVSFAKGDYTSLGVSVSPVGDSFKLSVNDSMTFTAFSSNASDPVFEWIISSSGNFTILVNDAPYELVKGDSLSVAGVSLTLCYPIATEEFVTVDLLVTDSSGVHDSLVRPFVVADPYNSPGYKIDGSTASDSYIVQADGLGWFRVLNGSDGSVISAYTSISANTTVNYALAACSAGGSVFVGVGNFSGAVAVVPDGVKFEVNRGATGLSYSAAVNATCAIVDWQNGYIDYYVAGDQTAYINFTAGTASFSPAVSWDGDWNATVEAVVDAFASMAWKGGWNATVADIVAGEFLTQSWNSDWNTTITSILAGSSIVWSQITNANTTVQQIVDAFSAMAWKDGWNATVADIASSSTSLESLASLVVSGTGTFGNLTLSSGIFPSDSTFVLYKDEGNVVAKHANGTICYQSATNTSEVFNAVTAIEGASVFVQQDTYTLSRYWVINSSTHKIWSNGAVLVLPDDCAVAEATTNLVQVAAGVDNVEFSGFELDGNAANNLDATTAHCGVGFYVRGDSENIRFHHNYVHDNRLNGVVVRASGSSVTKNVWIEYNTVIRSGYNDISFVLFDQTGVLRDCSANHNYVANGTGDISLDTFVIDRTGNPQVTNIVFSDNIGGVMDGVLGSTTDPYARNFIKLEDATNCTVTNNVGCGSVGVADDTYGDGGHTITGNTFYISPYVNATNPMAGDLRQAGINIATDDNLIANNRVYIQTGTYYTSVRGIMLGAEADNNDVSHNKIRDTGATGSSIGIIDSGDSNKFVENDIEGCDVSYTLWGDTTYYLTDGRQVFLYTVKETVTAGQLLCHNSTGYFKANSVAATSMGSMGAVALSIEAANANNVCAMIFEGVYTDSSWTWTVGAPLYASNSTSGALTENMPVSSGNVVQEVARALSATQIYFDPSLRLEVA